MLYRAIRVLKIEKLRHEGQVTHSRSDSEQVPVVHSSLCSPPIARFHLGYINALTIHRIYGLVF